LQEIPLYRELANLLIQPGDERLVGLLLPLAVLE